MPDQSFGPDLDDALPVVTTFADGEQAQLRDVLNELMIHGARELSGREIETIEPAVVSARSHERSEPPVPKIVEV